MNRASESTYHTWSEIGQHRGSSGDDKDTDTHKDKYKDKGKDRSFKKKVFLYIKVELFCVAIDIYRQIGIWHYI